MAAPPRQPARLATEDGRALSPCSRADARHPGGTAVKPLRPTRTDVAGRAYLDLQNLARRTGRATAELHQYYLLECFLDRLTRSTYSGQFVLKGGVLLAAFNSRRPTRDVDLCGTQIAADPLAIRQVITQVAAIDVDDGVIFDTRAA